MRVRVDTMGPDLARKIRRVRDTRPVMEAMGLAVVALTKRAFSDATLRAAPWRRKKDGSPATLRKTGTLWRGPRITRLGSNFCRVGSDRKYAAVHQLGSRKRRGRGSGIPPRPHFPFTADGRPTPRCKRAVREAAKTKLDSMLRGGA